MVENKMIELPDGQFLAEFKIIEPTKYAHCEVCGSYCEYGELFVWYKKSKDERFDINEVDICECSEEDYINFLEENYSNG